MLAREYQQADRAAEWLANQADRASTSPEKLAARAFCDGWNADDLNEAWNAAGGNPASLWFAHDEDATFAGAVYLQAAGQSHNRFTRQAIYAEITLEVDRLAF